MDEIKCDQNEITNKLAKRLQVSMEIAQQLIEHGEESFCSYPFIQFYTFADGTVRPCCYRGPFMGTLAEQSFDEIWNGPTWQNFRKIFLSGSLPKECVGCTSRSSIKTFINNHI
jgi:hypothetical protein